MSNPSHPLVDPEPMTKETRESLAGRAARWVNGLTVIPRPSKREQMDFAKVLLRYEATVQALEARMEDVTERAAVTWTCSVCPHGIASPSQCVTCLNAAIDEQAKDIVLLRDRLESRRSPSVSPAEHTDDGMATDEDILRALCGEAWIVVRDVKGDPAAAELAYRLNQAWRGEDPTGEGYAAARSLPSPIPEKKRKAVPDLMAALQASLASPSPLPEND